MDDYADRVYQVAVEVFPDADEALIQSVAANAFLKTKLQHIWRPRTKIILYQCDI